MRKNGAHFSRDRSKSIWMKFALQMVACHIDELFRCCFSGKSTWLLALLSVERATRSNGCVQHSQMGNLPSNGSAALSICRQLLFIKCAVLIRVRVAEPFTAAAHLFASPARHELTRWHAGGTASFVAAEAGWTSTNQLTRFLTLKSWSKLIDWRNCHKNQQKMRPSGTSRHR